MNLSSYQKSLWVRNALLVLFVTALIAAGVKIGLGLKKMALYDQARDYYEAHNLILAEKTFAQANGISAIRYGDDEWTELLSRLTANRLELESLAERALVAIRKEDPDQVLESYRRYQALKKESEQREAPETAFFQEISRRLRIETQLDAYFQHALKQAKSRAQANLAQKSYRDESFIHVLAVIPDAYYGGTNKKQDELSALLQNYEKTKLREMAARLSFAEVIASLADSVSTYEREGIEADWLLKRLEGYAREEINQAIRHKDLADFVAKAQALRQIKGRLPADSIVWTAIEDHLEDRLRQASQYVKSHQFEKALQLYQGLSSLQDTSTQIDELEKSWVAYDPARLLQTQYPDKAFHPLLTGADRWGARLYAIGWDEADQRLYVAAKMPDDAVLYLDQSLDADGKPVTISLSEALGEEKSPVILVKAQGKERSFAYTGLLPDLSQPTLIKRFALEAEDLQAESPDQVIAENPAGDGEGETAWFILDDTGLVYQGKADATAEGGEATDSTGGSENTEAPGSQTFEVRAGPGEAYEVIGQATSEDSMQILDAIDGWYHIRFDGYEGWIHAPDPTE